MKIGSSETPRYGVADDLARKELMNRYPTRKSRVDIYRSRNFMLPDTQGAASQTGTFTGTMDGRVNSEPQFRKVVDSPSVTNPLIAHRAASRMVDLQGFGLVCEFVEK